MKQFINNALCYPKLIRPAPFYTGFGSKLFENFELVSVIYTDFKYFIYAGRVLKRGVEVCLPLTFTRTCILTLNFKLIALNISFIFHTFIWDTE